MTLRVTIRPETADDWSGIEAVNVAAFGREGEATLVNDLRRSSPSCISLVATADDTVVGHVMFSPVSVRDAESEWVAAALAPLAVDPRYQRQGIGTRLVRAGLDACPAMGWDVTVVVGHSEYYPRFGFTRASLSGVACEFSVADEVFMLLELQAGLLRGRRGIVRYPDAFHRL